MHTPDPDVQAYFDLLPEDRREYLLRLHVMIKSVWPRIKEDMGTGMPTFHLDGKPLCAIGSRKNYMALYIMPYDLLAAFKNELRLESTGATCIRFKRISEEQYQLCEHIIKYVGSQFATSKLFDKLESKFIRHAEVAF